MGIILAIEEPEEAFVKRNYGKDHGILYKPGYTDVYAPNKDLALQYIDENIESYPNLFNNAKFKITEADKKRLIQSLKILDDNQNIEKAVNIDEVLRYFVVQVFVVNLDSYLGPTGHNYYLYEEDGMISMLPWDYNLAYGTYSLGMPNPSNDVTKYVNYPINTPYTQEVCLIDRCTIMLCNMMSILNNIMNISNILLMNILKVDIFKEGRRPQRKLIDSYVRKDPTAFCSYQDYLLGVDTFQEFCLLRSKSIRGQLEGQLPANLSQQNEESPRIDASHIRLEDMGEIADLYDEPIIVFQIENT